MKHIFLNLKRFDITKDKGGVNSLADMDVWAKTIVEGIDKGLGGYKNVDVEFGLYFPEAHLLSAVASKASDLLLSIGSQGVYRDDTALGGNFGAFTTNLTANAASLIGCDTTMIGHCEERKNYAEILSEAGVVDSDAVNKLLNKSVKKAKDTGLSVLYCIGEKAEEQDDWKNVLKKQLDIGLDDVDKSNICIAYEPVWAIGPGKTPPNNAYITKISKYIKEITDGLDVVYGGGLKQDNAKMLASIPSIDGGLIALTRFTGDIGFYPDEYLDIVKIYLDK